MNVPAGYKATEVGVIPVDWDVRRLGSVCKLINGRGFKPHEWSDRGLPIIRIQNLNGSADFNYFGGQFDPKILVSNGELLFAWSGSRGTSFGPHFWRGSNAVLNYHTWKIAVSSAVDRNCLFYVLKQLTREIEDTAHGASALVHTQKREMIEYLIPFPPTTAEQSAIAEALSDVDEAIAAQEAVIAKKRALKTATMQALLSGTRRLPGFGNAKNADQMKLTEIGRFPSDWNVRVLPDVLKFISGKAHEKHIVPYGKYIAVNSKFISTDGAVEKYSDRNFCPARQDDILMVMSDLPNGKALAKCFRVPENDRYAVNQRICILRSKGDDPGYLSYILNRNPYFMSFDDGVQQTHLLNGTFAACPLMIPPTIAEQRAISQTLDNMNSDLSLQTAKLTKLRHLKTGMMQQLLTGKIRLI